MKKLSGIIASQGIAIGPASHFRRADLKVERQKVKDPAKEWERLGEALVRAGQELDAVYTKALAETGAETAAIFQAHGMMLEDPELLEVMQKKIEGDHLNAEAALTDATEMYAQMLEALEDEYLRARAADIRDLSARVLRILLGVIESPIGRLKTPSIILAKELTPSDTISLDKAMVLGFATAEGGATSHVAILARELGLPAVVGLGMDLLDIPDGTPLILNGSEGVLVVSPEEATIAVEKNRLNAQKATLAIARQDAQKPAISRDGQRFEVAANIGSIESARAALEAGAEGVGLLRTEFLYLERDHMPDEEEQYQAYRAIVDVFGDLPVILRTLDIGGDKELPYLELPRELNPFMGLRAIRLCLARPDLFKPQLKAALRAGVDRNMKIMFPMVATVAEVRAARAILEECRAELVAEGKPAATHLEVGIMVEIPAAVVIADQLAAVVDFFSIGTNDLSQYTMAADRTNSQVSPLADAFQPAVLRLIRDVIKTAHQHGKWVGMCGELAGEPLALPILAGLGLDEFSMTPAVIPVAKQILRGLSLPEAQKVALAALNEDSPEKVKSLVEGAQIAM